MRVVQSRGVGMGKSLYIMRRAEELTDLCEVSEALISIRVHGPNISEDRIMCQLQSLQVTSRPCIVHFDISPSVSSDSY